MSLGSSADSKASRVTRRRGRGRDSKSLKVRLERTRADFSALSAVDIADLMGVDARTVTRWCGMGVPRNDDKTFDATSVIKWRISRAEARGEADQRQRLAAAQADRVERENAIAMGELIRAKDAVLVWGSIVGDTRNCLLALPNKIAPRLAHQPTERVYGLLRDEIHQVLDDLSEGRSDDGLSNLQKR